MPGCFVLSNCDKVKACHDFFVVVNVAGVAQPPKQPKVHHQISVKNCSKNFVTFATLAELLFEVFNDLLSEAHFTNEAIHRCKTTPLKITQGRR